MSLHGCPINLSCKGWYLMEMKPEGEEEQYQKQIDYIRTFYPDKQINIKGYGVVSLDTISNKQDLKGIVSNYNIVCSYCGKKINVNDWIVLLHNPKEFDKPINVLFFCSSNNNDCAVSWGQSKIKG